MMSLALMVRPKKLESGLQGFFDGLPVAEKPTQTWTRIGSLEDKHARISMTGTLIGAELVPSEYSVNLAANYRRNLGVVIASLWKVVRRELHEQGNGRKFALFDGTKVQTLENPEEIFAWYDAQRKGDLAVVPELNPDLYVPNIFTPQGVTELLEYGNFEGPTTDG